MSQPRPVRLLCTGDLHLGRYPTRVRADADVFSVASVWAGIVGYAIDQQLDGVVLTGDVVEAGNAHFEAYGPLKKGLSRLVEAGIPTFAVAGNHDYDVLPRLHRDLEVDEFHLLGRSGTWETVSIERDGSTVLHLCGWSFDRAHVLESPLATFECPPLASGSDIPVLGILHADLDAYDSRYAPVTLGELNEQPVAAWLLGHIHKPTLHAHRDGFILYPGSPQPLGTGETGAHGPWLVDVKPSGRAEARHLPMASVAYEPLEIDLEGADTAEEFRSRVLTGMEAAVAAIAEERPGIAAVRVTARYTGRTPLHSRLRDLDEQVREELSVAGVSARIVESEVAARPDLDLDALARGSDPVGTLAGLVLALDAGDEMHEEIGGFLAEMRRRAEELHRKPAFGPLREQPDGYDAPTEESLAPIVREQALRLIEEMMRQKPSGRAG